MKAVKLNEVHVGDIVTRMLGGTVPMQLKGTRANEKFVSCATPDGADEWTFERETGVEYDPELRWGSQFGATGSFISEAKKGSLTNGRRAAPQPLMDLNMMDPGELEATLERMHKKAMRRIWTGTECSAQPPWPARPGFRRSCC